MIQEQVRAWKWLKSQVEKVQDPVLRNAMMAEFRSRALRDWGYDPETGRPPKENELLLTDWERDLLDDIKKAQAFGLDINYVRKDKRAAEEKELQKNMYFFIRDGGSLADIPEEIRTNTVVDAYLGALKKIYDF